MTVLSPAPYKGTRDMYPEDLLKRNYIFETWKKTMLESGFSEYDSSIIESSEAFIIKSGQELGGEQLYSFEDKGGRGIALRPELTLSFARLIAQKYESLKFPIRWFSIANCFRYERPQKGRIREFYQLEINIAGCDRGPVDLEILNLSAEIFKAFGAKKEQYKIIFNSRLILEEWVSRNNWQSKKLEIFKILDNWYKKTEDETLTSLREILPEMDSQKILETCKQQGQSWQEYLSIAGENPEIKLILENIQQIQPDVDIQFAATIIRGQAYYTGLIFEAFDTNKENNRSLFGGGRFDNLLDLYGKKISAIGLAPGDVPWQEFLDSWNLWPAKLQSKTKVGIMVSSQNQLSEVFTKIIPELKKQGKIFDIDYSFERSENKRYETLKKRGADEILKV